MNSNKKIEQHFIGALLTQPKLMMTYANTPAEFFQDSNCAEIFEVMHKLYLEHGIFDNVLVLKEFPEMSDMQMFVMECIANTPGTHAIQAYYNTMRDGAEAEEMRKATLTMQDMIDRGDVRKAEGFITRSINKVRGWFNSDLDTNAQFKTWYETMCANIDNQGKVGIKTGYPTLDNVLGDLLPGQMHVLGARPKVGKSMVAVNIALHAAIQKKNVVYYSFEMSHEQMMNRLVSLYTKIPHAKFQRNKVTLEDLSLVSPYVDQFLKLPLTFVCRGGMTVDEIEQDIMKRSDQEKVDFVVLDYLQLIGHKVTNRYERITDISNRLKGIAMNRDVAVLALSQMSRESADGEPQVHHLRESGSIEQDAESIMLLWKEEGDGSDPRELKLLLRGNRNGPGYLNLLLDVDYGTFTVVERPHVASPAQAGTKDKKKN